MNILFNKITLKIISILSAVVGIAMILCAFVGMNYEEWYPSNILMTTGMAFSCIGLLLVFFLRNNKINFKPKDGYVISTSTWLFCSIAGTIPYVAYGYPVSSSFFESVAAFSTTGCSVFDLNTLPNCFLLWKAVSNWLGGMGVLVLVVTMFSALGINAKSIISSESTASIQENLGSRFSDTGKFLYITYTVFTIAEFILLCLSPLSKFDALINTLATISTSGLIITSSNIEALGANSTRAILLLFTLLTSINYYLYYHIVKGQWKKLLKNFEVKVFLAIITVSTILIGLDLRIQGGYESILKSLWDAICQVVSFISTAGYPTVNYINWPQFSIMILFCLMIVGGCSMSTSGSLKVIRIITLFKLIQRRIFKQVHNNGVRPIKIDGKPVSAERVSSTTTHIMLFFTVMIISCILLSLDGLDIETTVSTVLGLFTTTGLGLGEFGSIGYFGMFSPLSMYFLSILMIAGRLEIYTIIILFTRSFWQDNKANVI